MANLPRVNRRWLLAERPTAAITAQTFKQDEQSIPAPLPSGCVLVKNRLLSFEPAMRGWLDDEPSYLPPVEINAVMRAPAVAEVIAGDLPDYPAGSLLMGMTGWQEYAVLNETELQAMRLLPEGTPPAMALSVFGGTSLTAYFGLFDVGRPQPGETVLVSGAAGATGSCVAQMAKEHGCRVIGIAGGEEKCAWLRDTCGIADVIDYRSEDLDQRLTEMAPKGINLFFDNVGGETLETALQHMAEFGRIVMCGAIATYNDRSQPGPRNLFLVITRRLRIEGFVMLDYMDRVEEAVTCVTDLVMSGKLHWREDIQKGFDAIPATFERLFAGANTGKQLLSLEDDKS